MTEENKILLEAVLAAMPVLARYGARERNPDDEAWGAYTLAINALDKNGFNMFKKLEKA